MYVCYTVVVSNDTLFEVIMLNCKEKAEAYAALENCALFASLNEKERRLLLQADAVLRVYTRGDVIFRAQDPAPQQLCVLVRGRIRVYRERQGDDILLNELCAPGLFGVASLSDDAQTVPTTVRACETVRLLLLPRKALAACIRDNGTFALAYVQFLSGRIRFLNDRIAAFTAGSAAQRLGSYLCAVLSPGQTRVFSRSMLARQLAMGRASLYRALDVLVAQGAIETEGKNIRLLNQRRCLAPAQAEESNAVPDSGAEKKG